MDGKLQHQSPPKTSSLEHIYAEVSLLNESHSIYIDNTQVLGYAIVDT